MMNQIETSTYYPKLTKLLLSKQKPEGDGSCDSTYRQKHRKKKKKKKKKKPPQKKKTKKKKKKKKQKIKKKKYFLSKMGGEKEVILFVLNEGVRERVHEY